MASHGAVCQRCSGTGRIGGHGPAIVSQHPVTQVVTDKRPLKVQGDEDYRWARQNGRGDHSWILPAEIFDHLLPDPKCFRVMDDFVVSVRSYRSEQDAIAGLSVACIRWARSKK